ncbi:MAG: hypothetical protein ACL7BU_12100 [Candidatus Phlomobacter fragariae]
MEGKADASSVKEISKNLANKFDKKNIAGESGSATGKVMSQKTCTDTFVKKSSTDTIKCHRLIAKDSEGNGAVIVSSAHGNEWWVQADNKTKSGVVVE